MHIPDGYLGPVTYIALFAAMIPIWFIASRKVNQTLDSKRIPFLAFGIAFSFLIQMFNVPAPGATTGHAVGGVIMAIAAGPYAAIIGVSAVLVIQALLFGDGGITAIGANCFNMAFILPVSGYFIYKFLSFKANISSPRNWVAAAIAGYVALNIAAMAVAIELGIQPILHTSETGQPLYSPYSLDVTVPVMAIEHLAIFGFIEAAATGLVVSYFTRVDPTILTSQFRPPMANPIAASSNSARSWRKLWIALLAIVIITPIGLLATGTPFGEGGSEDLLAELSYIPEGFSELAETWSAPLPDYTIMGWEEGTLGSLAYVVSAIIGVILTAGIIYFAKIGLREKRLAKTNDRAH